MKLPFHLTIRAFLSCLLLAALALVYGPVPAAALTAEPPTNQAGLVVVQADGSVESRCVGFSEESINGLDLLARGGFTVRSEITAMGASVCSVDGQGCGEGEDCFCQCLSSPCVYWTYWQQLPEGWRYANVGAASLQVHDGDVQGWVWGDSSPNAAAKTAPPALAFTDICNTDAVVFGIEAATSAAQPEVDASQTWMAAIAVGAPLLLGGAWWLLQRRKEVQG